MRPVSFRGALIAVMGGVAACGLLAGCAQIEGRQPDPDAAVLAQRAQRFTGALASPDSNARFGGAIARWEMPQQLSQISGLTLTADGRLFGHGDGHAHVFEIDYRRGVLVKEFTLVAKGQPVKGDFEAITVANDGRMFLMTSDGKLYEFKEGADGAKIAFTEYDTGLKDQCEFESAAYDAKGDALLLACKKLLDKALKDSVVIFRWKLAGDSARSARLSHISIPLKLAIGANGWDGLHPSDLTINPLNGDYVLVASRESAILEVTPAGKVVFSRPLPGVHDQAEGVAITRDSLLIVSDEAASKNADAAGHPHRVADDADGHRPAFVTVYRWR